MVACALSTSPAQRPIRRSICTRKKRARGWTPSISQCINFWAAAAPGVLIFNQRIYVRTRSPTARAVAPCCTAVPLGTAGLYQRYRAPRGRRARPHPTGDKSRDVHPAEGGNGRGQHAAAGKGRSLRIVFDRFSRRKNVRVLEAGAQKRLGVISFVVAGAHHDLIVRMLNDRFGIQTRGGCSCAGTYGHRLLGVGRSRSAGIRASVLSGDLSGKPGWVRISVHPVMTDGEICYIMGAIEQAASQHREWAEDYAYDAVSNEWSFKGCPRDTAGDTQAWFCPGNWETAT